MLARALLDSEGQRCVTGFAPAGAAKIDVAGTGPVRKLRLYRVPGIDSPVYAGIVPATDGTLQILEGGQQVLACCPMTR